MPTSNLAGWIVDVRKRVHFVPANAFVTSLRDPKVVVFNQQGYFFIPNLEPGRTYEFLARNGDAIKRLTFTPKAGHNELAIAVPTKPARIPKATSGKPSVKVRKAGA